MRRLVGVVLIVTLSSSCYAYRPVTGAVAPGTELFARFDPPRTVSAVRGDSVVLVPNITEVFGTVVSAGDSVRMSPVRSARSSSGQSVGYLVTPPASGRLSVAFQTTGTRFETRQLNGMRTGLLVAGVAAAIVIGALIIAIMQPLSDSGPPIY